jgi:hypothetical protein
MIIGEQSEQPLDSFVFYISVITGILIVTTVFFSFWIINHKVFATTSEGRSKINDDANVLKKVTCNLFLGRNVTSYLKSVTHF